MHIRDDLAAQQAKLGWVDGIPPRRSEKVMRWAPSPPSLVKCHPWPEVTGLEANVWEKAEWVPPWLGFG